MTTFQPPYVLQAASHPAQLFRQAMASFIASPGPVAPGGLLVSAHSPANLSVNVLGGAENEGGIWIASSTPAQGYYYCWNESTTQLFLATANTANPRIDRIVARVQDEAVSGSGNSWKLEVIEGTPTPGATLENLSGVKAAPASSYTLAYVLVPQLATSVTNTDIKNVATQFALDIGGGGYEPAVARTSGVEYEPSTTRAIFVMLQNSAESNTNIKLAVSVGGALLCLGELPPHTGEGSGWPISFIVPAATKWRADYTHTGAGGIESRYLPL